MRRLAGSITRFVAGLKGRGPTPGPRDRILVVKLKTALALRPAGPVDASALSQPIAQVRDRLLILMEASEGDLTEHTGLTAVEVEDLYVNTARFVDGFNKNDKRLKDVFTATSQTFMKLEEIAKAAKVGARIEQEIEETRLKLVQQLEERKQRK